MLFFSVRETIASSPAKRDRVVLSCLISSLVINIAVWIALIVGFWRSADIVLHYNIYFGISSLGAWYWILFIPFWGLLALAANSFLAFKFYLKQKLLSEFLMFAALAVNLFLAVGAGLLVYANW